MKVWSLDYVNRHYFPQHFKLLCLSSWNVRSVEEELLGNAIRIVKVFWCLLTMLEPMVILILTVPLRILQCFAASLSLWGRWPWPLLGCFAQRRENEKTTTHKTKKSPSFPLVLLHPEFAGEFLVTVCILPARLIRISWLGFRGIATSFESFWIHVLRPMRLFTVSWNARPFFLVGFFVSRGLRNPWVRAR